MDIQIAASTLRQQLISLQHSDRTVSILEREITSLNEQCLMTAIENNQSRHLRLLLRLSIIEGVHQMYEQYSSKKWSQVQNIAKSVTSQLESDDDDSSPPMTTSSTMARQQPDKAVDQWSSVFCEMSRDD